MIFVSEEKWDRRFLELAKQISTWSKDPSTKVGAVIVKDRKVVGMGYNGFPPGIEDTEERLNNRELKYKLVVHAEINAILQAGEKAKGATLYVYPSLAFPPVCNDCCKAVINAGITDIVGYLPDEISGRWSESAKASVLMCEEVKMSLRKYHEF